MKRKCLAIGIILLLLGLGTLPMVESVPIEKENSVISKSYLDDIVISGTMGENGWYVSSVTITFVDGNGTWVRCFVKIDSGNWFEYFGPLVVSSDGVHTVWWFYIDQWGIQSPVYSVTFKIDTTPPEISLMKERTGINKIKFIATVCDAISGIWRVEFYLDDELQFTDYDFPFEWTWDGSGNHNVTATVFDFAGNSASSSMSTPYILSFIQNSYHNHQIIKLLLNLIMHHKYSN